MGIRSLIFPSCKELAHRLSSGGYERAAWPVRMAVRWHLYRCELCERYARQMTLLAEGYKTAAGRDAPAELKRKIAQKLRETRDG